MLLSMLEKPIITKNLCSTLITQRKFGPFPLLKNSSKKALLNWLVMWLTWLFWDLLIFRFFLLYFVFVISSSRFLKALNSYSEIPKRRFKKDGKIENWLWQYKSFNNAYHKKNNFSIFNKSTYISKTMCSCKSQL